MLEFVALCNLSAANTCPDAPLPAVRSRTPAASWEALVESLLRAIAEKNAPTARGVVEAAPWTVVLDPTVRTCLNVGAATPAGVDAGRAAELSVGRFLLCVWAEGFSNAFVFLCYRDGKPVRRLVVVNRAVELADGSPMPDEPADLADLDHTTIGAMVRACHLDMDRVRAAGVLSLVTLTAPARS